MLARSPRFRLVFLMGFSFGLLIWLPLAFGNKNPGSVFYLALFDRGDGLRIDAAGRGLYLERFWIRPQRCADLLLGSD